MKQLILLSIIAICFVKISTAQDVELIDSNQYNLSYKIMADSCLKNVNLDSVPYGILLGKAFSIRNTLTLNKQKLPLQ